LPCQPITYASSIANPYAIIGANKDAHTQSYRKTIFFAYT
jgi:hypothetical protein